MDFKFSREHFKTACGALVVPGAVVGNHWNRALDPKFYSQHLEQLEQKRVLFNCSYLKNVQIGTLLQLFIIACKIKPILGMKNKLEHLEIKKFILPIHQLTELI